MRISSIAAPDLVVALCCYEDSKLSFSKLALRRIFCGGRNPLATLPPPGLIGLDDAYIELGPLAWTKWPGRRHAWFELLILWTCDGS